MAAYRADGMFKAIEPVQTLAEAVRSELGSMFEWANSNLACGQSDPLMHCLLGSA